jgi:hypothetical protein
VAIHGCQFARVQFLKALLEPRILLFFGVSFTIVDTPSEKAFSSLARSASCYCIFSFASSAAQSFVQLA